MTRQEKAKKVRDRVKASINVARSMIRIDELSKEELDDLKILYPSWKEKMSYSIGDIVRYDDEVYRVIQKHTSQADWTPDKVPNLFNKIVPDGVIPEWEQPLGGHDAYNKGDKVIFEDKVYESLNDANVHSPSAFPQGWKLVD